MPPIGIDSPAALEDWFQRSGVDGPLHTCIGPLPASKAAIVRWSENAPDAAIQTVSPHPDSYRIAVMLEPLESQIWVGDRPIWGGMIAANRFRICAPGTANRWRRLSSCDIVNIFIPAETVEGLAGVRGDPVPAAALGSTLFTPDRQVLDLVWKMLDAEMLAGPLSPLFCDGLITALLGYLLEHYRRPATAAEQGSLGSTRLRRVKDYVSLHLAEDVSIAALAELCAMSESHFSREFRRSVGLPPHQYVLKLRLERARDALQATDDAIVDIAGECGFNNASHFSRAFALRYGMPPASFRREHRSRV
jgi:AraC family transcriptional regulator